ncbi:hypothetical protein NONI108955_22985 [Nocardia ninae]
MLHNSRPRLRGRYLTAHSASRDRPHTPAALDVRSVRPETFRGDSVPVSRTCPELAQCLFDTCRSIYDGHPHRPRESRDRTTLLRHAAPPVHGALSTRAIEHVPHSTTGQPPD